MPSAHQQRRTTEACEEKQKTCLEHIVMSGRGSDRRDTSNLIATGPAPQLKPESDCSAK